MWHLLSNYGKGWLVLCSFVWYTSGVFESVQPDEHVDNVGGFITDGSCMCCQLCVSQLYQNMKLGPKLQRAVTAWWGIKTTEQDVRLKLTLLWYCLHDMKYITPAFASLIKYRTDRTSWRGKNKKRSEHFVWQIDKQLCRSILNRSCCYTKVVRWSHCWIVQHRLEKPYTPGENDFVCSFY